MEVSKSDIEKVTEQIGRLPHGMLEVVARNANGEPTCIMVDPLVKGKPFPTTFWLTCPKFKRDISRLESAGLISELEKDSELINSLAQDHLNYKNFRTELLKKNHPNWNELPEGLIEPLMTTGVGGIRDFKHIKCLHLHFAHFLAGENSVGALIAQKIRFQK